MKVAVISDLHGAPFPKIEEEIDLLLVAGDITTDHTGTELLDSFYDGPSIFTVAGNHEFYGHDYDHQRERLDREFYAENELLLGTDYRVLGCTLWTDFCLDEDTLPQQVAMAYGRRGLNDFHMIKRWSPERSVEVHKESVAWLKTELKKPFGGKTIVLSHHCPSMLSVAPQYEGSVYNACFSSNLDYLFPHVDLWVHGHTHTAFDYQVGRCRVVCNPHGYAHEVVHPYKAKVIEL